MTRIATLLSTTALAATAGAWMAWAPLAGAEAGAEPRRRSRWPRRRTPSPTWSSGPARRW